MSHYMNTYFLALSLVRTHFRGLTFAHLAHWLMKAQPSHCAVCSQWRSHPSCPLVWRNSPFKSWGRFHERAALDSKPASCLSGSLVPLQQMALLTTYLETLFFWSPLIPLLSLVILGTVAVTRNNKMWLSLRTTQILDHWLLGPHAGAHF